MTITAVIPMVLLMDARNIVHILALNTQIQVMVSLLLMDAVNMKMDALNMQTDALISLTMH